ncbi:MULTISPECIES: hypothetical protein [Bacillus]|uniref:Uncharacterized protein n=1 Tax=Bacillus cereus TaxID=1396 RepID=A0A9X6GH38_BACCE|nr:hypothetical protein [Bacillus cereus]OOR76019.1 hypothetical protein BLX06_05270 [Bacillus cereus]
MDKIVTTHVGLVNGKVHIFQMSLEKFLDKVVAPDGSFREGLIRFNDILINPEQIVSVQQVSSVRTRRPSRIIE